MDKQDHQFGERFCLMWYGCKCGHRERIWNSRNGVTPFGLDCPSCGGSLNHVDWKFDFRDPAYRLVNGQRYFADGTPDEAEAIMRRRIEQMKGTPYECDEATANSLIAVARAGEDEFTPGWPMVRRHEA